MTAQSDVRDRSSFSRRFPFDGLGDGRHGSISIAADATATEMLFQATDVNIASTKTWTAKAINPGGFILGVLGRLTIEGTVDVSFRGAAGISDVRDLHLKL